MVQVSTQVLHRVALRPVSPEKSCLHPVYVFSAWLFLAFSRHVALRICVLSIYLPILDDSKWLPPARIEGGYFPI